MHNETEERIEAPQRDAHVVAMRPDAPPTTGSADRPGDTKSDGFWQGGSGALSRSWDEWRIGWMRLASWTRAKVAMVTGAPSNSESSRKRKPD